jgi:hypothetical protein
MRLREWVLMQGRGELLRLHHVTELSYTTVHALYRETQLATYASAAKISAATEGAVSVPELCEARVTRKPRPKRKRASKRPAPEAST